MGCECKTKNKINKLEKQFNIEKNKNKKMNFFTLKYLIFIFLLLIISLLFLPISFISKRNLILKKHKKWPILHIG